MSWSWALLTVAVAALLWFFILVLAKGRGWKLAGKWHVVLLDADFHETAEMADCWWFRSSAWEQANYLNSGRGVGPRWVVRSRW
mgnify:CR=1 FL=1